MTEDEIVGWRHQFDGHKFEQSPGAGDGRGNAFYHFYIPEAGRPNLAVNVSLFYLFDFFYPFSLSSTIRPINKNNQQMWPRW